MNRRRSLDRDTAESLAIQALGYLAAEPARLGRFLALCGLEPGEIRGAAAEPGFLAGVLEYLNCDESLLLAFADQASVDPADLGRAQAILSADRRERESP
jgi:hypothetical protein